MRPILIGDIIAVARSVLDLPRREWANRIIVMLDQAHIADKVTKRTGRPHPVWGNGSLLSASKPKPDRPEPFARDVHYLEALRETLVQILEWKRQRRISHWQHKA